MSAWRIGFVVAHIVQFVVIWSLLKDFHFVDPSLYNEVKDKASLDAIRVASELGRFDMASMFLAGISILIGLAAIFGFVEVRSRSEKRAEETARQIVEKMVPDLFNEAMKVRDGFLTADTPLTPAAEAAVIAKSNEIQG